FQMRLLVGSLLLVSSVFSAEFDDSLARNFFMPLSAAAYSDTPQQCLDREMAGAKISKQVTVKCDYFRDKCSGFTFVDEERKIIGLSFRGSNNPAQMIIEIQESGFEKKVDFKDGGKVSKYFNEAFMDLWDGGLGADLSYLIMTYHDYDLWITGHSLGGALASLSSAHIVSLDWYDQDRIYLYTFGQPRVGDQDYANVHDSFVKTAFRVVHDRDLVAHSPPEFEKFVHHKYEVFYPNNMKEGDSYTVCSEQEDKKCSDKYTFETSISDHDKYYGKEVSKFGKNGCK
ncbi:hypothetical protein PENTCL1PPCAC_2880, partial [Pristionchus entomophagus]